MPFLLGMIRLKNVIIVLQVDAVTMETKTERGKTSLLNSKIASLSLVCGKRLSALGDN